MDLKATVDMTAPKDKLNENLEFIELGNIELKSGKKETVRLVRFAGKNDQGTWMGLFIPEGREDGWDKWLEGSGYKDKAVMVDLDPIKKERLKILARTNLPPIFIFNLAMNTEVDLAEIMEKYSYIKGPAMLTIGSSRSEQGKSTLTAIEGEKWGSAVVTADIFAKDNGETLKNILKESGWDGKEVNKAFEIISANREWQKLSGVSFGDYINLLWDKWTNTFSFMIIDLPGMKIENGGPTRLTDGMDVLRMAIPCYEIPMVDKKVGGFDADYQEIITEGYYQAIKDTWHLDEERVAGLRNLLQV